MKHKSLKHLVISILMACALLPASAEIHDTGARFSGEPRFFVKEFCVNKTPRLYVGDRTESGGDEFTILDETFKEIDHFTTPVYPKVTASYSRAYGISEPADITVSYYDRPMNGYESKEELVAKLDSWFTIVEEQGNETWYLSSDHYDYYYYEFFGNKYPRLVYIWNNVTSEGIERHYQYQNGSWKPTGSYGEPQFYEDSHTPYPESIYPRNGNCVDNDNIMFTQTLFNKDENIEWIVPIVEAVECSYITQNYKFEGTQLHSTGFRVESQNGSVVTTVMFPTGIYGKKYLDIFLYMMGDKNYLLVDVNNLSQTEQYYIVYEIDAAKGSVQAIDAPRRVSVAPTMPRRGTDVNIDLGSPAETACKVIVTSVSGQTVMTRNIAPGTTRTTIDTSRFENGMYIVSVSDGKTTRENTKIVVR